jgi:hypothetical protein
MSKLVITFNTAIDLLAHVRAAVVRSSRCRPWDFINRLEERKGEIIACAQEARTAMSLAYERLYSNCRRSSAKLTQAQRLAIIDAAMGTR